MGSDRGGHERQLARTAPQEPGKRSAALGKEALNQLVFENAASLYKIPVTLPPIQTDLGRFGNAIAISEPAVMKMPALPAISGRRPVRFAPDSPLEEAGFELVVPL